MRALASGGAALAGTHAPDDSCCEKAFENPPTPRPHTTGSPAHPHPRPCANARALRCTAVRKVSRCATAASRSGQGVPGGRRSSTPDCHSHLPIEDPPAATARVQRSITPSHISDAQRHKHASSLAWPRTEGGVCAGPLRHTMCSEEDRLRRTCRTARSAPAAAAAARHHPLSPCTPQLRAMQPFACACSRQGQAACLGAVGCTQRGPACLQPFHRVHRAIERGVRVKGLRAPSTAAAP